MDICGGEYTGGCGGDDVTMAVAVMEAEIGGGVGAGDVGIGEGHLDGQVAYLADGGVKVEDYADVYGASGSAGTGTGGGGRGAE